MKVAYGSINNYKQTSLLAVSVCRVCLCLAPGGGGGGGLEYKKGRYAHCLA